MFVCLFVCLFVSDQSQVVEGETESKVPVSEEKEGEEAEGEEQDTPQFTLDEYKAMQDKVYLYILRPHLLSIPYSH